MNQIKISIITASYNYADYIKETIESVIAQTYSNWELIIVDDGSKDNSLDVIKSYCEKDERIKLYTHENNANKGLSETVKLGIKKAESEWIAFLESDDKFAPDCLEKKVEIIRKNPKIKFVFSDLEMFGDSKEIEIAQKAYYNRLKKYLGKTGAKDLNNCYLFDNPVSTFSVVMLQKTLIKDLDFNSPIKPLLDYYLWAQIASENKFYYINEKLTFWRMHKSSYIHEEVDSAEFKKKIYEFCNRNLISEILILLLKFKEIRRNFVRVKFGRNAKLEIFGKVIYKKESSI